MQIPKLLINSLFYQLRHRRRVQRWVKAYRRYLSGELDKAPLPAVLQLIPTEKCNLRCKMCNQWGEHGYFIDGSRNAGHAPEEPMAAFLNRFSAMHNDFLLSLHGGEPLAWPHLASVLEIVRKRKLDTMITTNGTLITKHLDALAKANPYVVYLLSIDGDEKTNDNIRGEGVTRKIRDGIKALQKRCRELGTGPVRIIVNYCVAEHNPDAADTIVPIARELNALAINYNMRWYLTEQNGLNYDAWLKEEFNIEGSGAWRGWISDHSFAAIPHGLKKIYRKHRQWRNKILPPLVSLLPRGLSENQAVEFYRNHDQTFGINACIMPSYQVRIHSNGEMIFCPGHPDVIAGNVFTEDFETVYYNQTASHFRRHVEKQLLPICNRCCGIFMTYEATQKLGKPFVPCAEETFTP